MVAPVKGTQNLSDKLSRLFDLPKVIEESVDLRSLRISKELEEIEDRAMTVLEARDAVSELGIRHWQDKEKVHPIIKAISVEELDRWMPEDDDLGTLNIHQKTLLENIFPIKELAERLDTENCLLYTSPSPRDRQKSRMPSSA